MERDYSKVVELNEFTDPEKVMLFEDIKLLKIDQKCEYMINLVAHHGSAASLRKFFIDRGEKCGTNDVSKIMRDLGINMVRGVAIKNMSPKEKIALYTDQAAKKDGAAWRRAAAERETYDVDKVIESLKVEPKDKAEEVLSGDPGVAAHKINEDFEAIENSDYSKPLNMGADFHSEVHDPETLEPFRELERPEPQPTGRYQDVISVKPDSVTNPPQEGDSVRFKRPESYMPKEQSFERVFMPVGALSLPEAEEVLSVKLSKAAMEGEKLRRRIEKLLAVIEDEELYDVSFKITEARG